MQELDTQARRHVMSAAIELVNLTLDPSIERFVTPATGDLTADVNAITRKLRYQPLAIPDLNWSICALLRLVLDSPQQTCDEELTRVALGMTKHGYSSDLIVALLAAGHEPGTATAARDILTNE